MASGLGLMPLMAADGSPNLNAVPAMLTVPAVTRSAPAAGMRVRATTAGWTDKAVYHALYLPTDWAPGKTFPVIVEYAGNGGYKNAHGDTSDGSVDGCMMGYGLSGGRGFIWVAMPLVGADGRNADKWWGDVEATKRYCRDTVAEVCGRFGGDPRRVVLAGFSRGAIACNYIGLHDDEMARLWCGMICHSHYDGIFRHPAPDLGAWKERLQRLGARPQFISHERSVERTREWIAASGVKGDFTFAALPFENHSTRWTLCDLPIRTQARAWLLRCVGMAEER
jgi:hypothetical protein